MAREACCVWQAPQLPDNVFQAHNASGNNGQSYSLDDPRQLALSPLRTVFRTLQQAVLALDPCIIEEVLKLCIACKAETNFVDVVPQARPLLLSLNMPFQKLTTLKACAGMSLTWAAGPTSSQCLLPMSLGPHWKKSVFRYFFDSWWWLPMLRKRHISYKFSFGKQKASSNHKGLPGGG